VVSPCFPTPCQRARTVFLRSFVNCTHRARRIAAFLLQVMSAIEKARRSKEEKAKKRKAAPAKEKGVVRLQTEKKLRLQLLIESIPTEVWVHVLSFLDTKGRAKLCSGFGRRVGEQLRLAPLLRFVCAAPAWLVGPVLGGGIGVARAMCTCTTVHDILAGVVECERRALARATVQARARALRERWEGRRVLMRWPADDVPGREAWYAGVVIRCAPSGLRVRVWLDDPDGVGDPCSRVHWAHEAELRYEIQD
jgi:hypothetical protein